MADETMSTYTKKIIHEPGALAPMAVKIAGTTIKAGFVVSAVGQTFGTDGVQRDVALCTVATTHVPYGVVLQEPDVDIDTAHTDNDAARVARIGSGAVVWCFLKTSAATALYPGMPVYAPTDGGGSIEVLLGMATNATASWAANRLRQQQYVGIADDYQAVSAGGWTCVKVILTGAGCGALGGA